MQRSFLVINVCNQGKTLCSPCTLPFLRANYSHGYNYLYSSKNQQIDTILKHLNK